MSWPLCVYPDPLCHSSVGSCSNSYTQQRVLTPGLSGGTGSRRYEMSMAKMSMDEMWQLDVAIHGTLSIHPSTIIRTAGGIVNITKHCMASRTLSLVGHSTYN